MDKEVIKLIHRANQLTKQNIYCIFQVTVKTILWSPIEKNIVKFFLPKSINSDQLSDPNK